jgi:hypothetical protein
MARRLVAAVSAAAAVCLAAPAAMAIVPTGSIHGSVTDGTNPVQASR